MNEFKDIKRRARRTVKRHYVLLVAVCAVAILVGTEFSGLISQAQTWYDALTGQEIQPDAEGLHDGDATATGAVLDALLNGDADAGRQQADARLQAIVDESDPNAMLGHQRGVLAALINDVNSGRLTAMVGAALFSVSHSGTLSAALLIIGSLVVYAAVWVFFKNVLAAVVRRVLLDARTYKAVTLGHLLHFKAVRRWTRVSMTLLLKSVYETLWWMTIVGGVVKSFSYRLVPFIAAENPDIRPKDAIALSRRMMDGHKWECFLLELSFAGWRALGFVTFGAAEALWGLPYRLAALTEFYALRRQEAIERGIEGAALLNDACLFERADPGTLRQRYADIARRQDLIDEDIVMLTPRQRFFARNFGLWLGTLMEKRVYSRQEGLRHQARVGMQEMNGEAYPQRMNPLWDREAAALTGRVNYLAPCTVWTLIVVFFAFCVVGWVWEVALHFITDGEFANRGALHGPWLPIYGGGVVLIAVLLYRFRQKPILEAVAIVALCGFVEYMTSYFLELSRGMRWWDYTGYFLNLNGRICGEGLAVFAVGGMAAVYLLIPVIDAMVIRVKPRILVPACLLLLTCFGVDFVYSQFVPNVGAGVTEAPVEAGP